MYKYFIFSILLVRTNYCEKQKIQTGYYTGKTQLAKVKQQCVCKDNRERFIPVFSSKKGRQEEKREKGKVRLEKGEEVGASSAMRHGRT